MKLSLRATIIIFALLFNVLFATEAKAQIIKEILKRMQAHQKALRTFRANLTRESYNVLLDEKDNFSGTVIYARLAGNQGMALRVDWTKPRAESLSLVNDQYIAYTPAIKQAYVGSIARSKVLESFSLVNLSVSELKASYDISNLGQETIKGGTPTFHLQLTPKKRMRFSTVDLWVDKDGMVRQTRVNHLNKDTDTFLLSELQKNTPVTSNVFPIKLPKGTRLIKDSNNALSVLPPNIKLEDVRIKSLKAKRTRRVKTRKKRLPLKVRSRNNKIKRKAAR